MLKSFKEYRTEYLDNKEIPDLLEDLDNKEIPDLLEDIYKDIVDYKNEVKGSEDLGYKIDSMVEMLDAVRAYLAFSTAALLNMRLTKDR